MPEQDKERMAGVTARFPVPLVDRLSKVAARLDRSVSWCIRRAVEEWLAKQGRK